METRTKLELAAACSALVALWYVSLPADHQDTGQTTRPEVADELRGAGKTAITPPKVPVYKPEAKNDLDLPPDVIADPNKYVAAAVTIPRDTHPHTVTATIDAKTGVIDMFDRRDPLPWLAAEQTCYVRLSYGVRTDIGQVYRLSGSENLLSIKALHFGVDGSLDSDGQGYVGAHVDYAW
ncbi:MAG: hypothetical protein WC736_15790 [Gallionella sp.]|jgi:hypothetical protein